MNRRTRGERPQQKPRKQQAACRGRPKRDAGERAPAPSGETQPTSAGVSGNAARTPLPGASCARCGTTLTKTHIKPRLLQKPVLSEHRMRRCRGHNSIFTTRYLFSCIIARWKTSRWHVFRIMSGPPHRKRCRATDTAAKPHQHVFRRSKRPGRGGLHHTRVP